MSMRSLSRLLILIAILSFLASVSEAKPMNRGGRRAVDRAHAYGSGNGKMVKKLRQFDIKKAAAEKRADSNSNNCVGNCPSKKAGGGNNPTDTGADDSNPTVTGPPLPPPTPPPVTITLGPPLAAPPTQTAVPAGPNSIAPTPILPPTVTLGNTPAISTPGSPPAIMPPAVTPPSASIMMPNPLTPISGPVSNPAPPNNSPANPLPAQPSATISAPSAPISGVSPPGSAGTNTGPLSGLPSVSVGTPAAPPSVSVGTSAAPAPAQISPPSASIPGLSSPGSAGTNTVPLTGLPGVSVGTPAAPPSASGAIPAAPPPAPISLPSSVLSPSPAGVNPPVIASPSVPLSMPLNPVIGTPSRAPAPTASGSISPVIVPVGSNPAASAVPSAVSAPNASRPPTGAAPVASPAIIANVPLMGPSGQAPGTSMGTTLAGLTGSAGGAKPVPAGSSPASVSVSGAPVAAQPPGPGDNLRQGSPSLTTVVPETTSKPVILRVSATETTASVEVNPPATMAAKLDFANAMGPQMANLVGSPTAVPTPRERRSELTAGMIKDVIVSSPDPKTVVAAVEDPQIKNPGGVFTLEQIE